MTDTNITYENSRKMLRKLVYGAHNQAKKLANDLKPFVLAAMFVLSGVSATSKNGTLMEKNGAKTVNISKDFRNYVEAPVSDRLVICDAEKIRTLLYEGKVEYGELAFSAEELNRACDVKSDLADAFCNAYIKNMKKQENGFCLRAFRNATDFVKNQNFDIFQNFSKNEWLRYRWTIGNAYEAKQYLDKMEGLVAYKRTDGRTISEIKGEIRFFDKGKTESGHIECADKGNVYYDEVMHRKTPNKPYGDLTCYAAEKIVIEVIAKDAEANVNKYKMFANEDGTYYLAQGDNIPVRYKDLNDEFEKEQQEKMLYMKGYASIMGVSCISNDLEPICISDESIRVDNTAKTNKTAPTISRGRC